MRPLDKVVTTALKCEDKGSRADLRKGATKHTESYAYPHVLPYVPPRPDGTYDGHLETVALRVAAMIATHYHLAQVNKLTLGCLCRQCGVGDRRVLALQNLDVGQAAEEISRWLRTCQGIGLDWYRLADMLARWGDGTSDGSLRTRQQVARDYYRAPAQADNEPAERQQEQP